MPSGAQAPDDGEHPGKDAGDQQVLPPGEGLAEPVGLGLGEGSSREQVFECEMLAAVLSNDDGRGRRQGGDEALEPGAEEGRAQGELGRELGPEGIVLVSLSGRGDKDMETAARYFGLLDAAAAEGEHA